MLSSHLCRYVADLIVDREQRRDAVDFVLDVQATCDPAFSQTTVVRLKAADGYDLFSFRRFFCCFVL